MIKVLLIILVVLFIPILVLFGVDLYHFLFNRYCRFHIGRFSSDDEWKKKLTQKSLKWLKKEPTVKITDNSRYLLFDMISGKYRSKTIQSWQRGSIILGLSEMESSYQKEIDDSIANLIDKNGNFRSNPTNVDCGLLSYSILKNSDKTFVQPAMDYAASLIMSKKGKDGLIAYSNDSTVTSRYVDTIGLAIPFLALYGKAYDKPEFVCEAINQLKLFSEKALMANTLLPNHAIDGNTGLPLGVFGWGRGCGWYTLGLIDTYLELEEKDEWLYSQIKSVADSYMSFQREDGGFGYIFQMCDGYDSSATACMAYFYSKCYAIFKDEKYRNVSTKCINKLKSVTRISGSLDWCQGDTKGIGVFSQTYDIMPFAQGMLLRTIGELDK